MTPVVNPETLSAIKAEVTDKKSRMNKCVLHKDRQTLLITLMDGKQYVFEPTREEMIEYWERAYTNEETEKCIDWEDYSLEVWSNKERRLFASMNRKKWRRVKLKEVSLPAKVQRVINRKICREYKNGRYTCAEIIRRYTPEGNSYTIVGEFEKIGLIVEATTLQGAGNKLLANVRQVATAMTLKEMKVV